MPYLPAMAVDARHLDLVTLPTHRCAHCGAPVDVQRVEATTFKHAAQRLRVYLWGRHNRCHCGNTDHPVPLVGDDYLTHGWIGGWYW